MFYCDLPDETYTRGRRCSLSEKRAWGRLQVYDSNTVGCAFLCVAVSQKEPNESSAHIRLNLSQAMKLVAAINAYISFASNNQEPS